MADDAVAAEGPPPAAEPRAADARPVLSEFNKGSGTPKRLSPEEFIIAQRGPRHKPETWSPLEFSRTIVTRDRTPERRASAPGRPEIGSKLRRRLNLSPGKGESPVGAELMRKIKNLPRYGNSGRKF